LLVTACSRHLLNQLAEQTAAVNRAAKLDDLDAGSIENVFDETEGVSDGGLEGGVALCRGLIDALSVLGPFEDEPEIVGTPKTKGVVPVDRIEANNDDPLLGLVDDDLLSVGDLANQSLFDSSSEVHAARFR
jgi:hypothetical protein